MGIATTFYKIILHFLENEQSDICMGHFTLKIEHQILESCSPLYMQDETIMNLLPKSKSLEKRITLG